MTDILLSKILKGQASAKEVEFFAEWIKDIDNERYFDDFKAIWHVAGNVEVSNEKLDRSLSTFMNYIRSSRRRHIRRSRILYAISSAAILLLFIGIFRDNKRYSFSDLKFSQDSIKLELADGSIVNPVNKKIEGIELNPVNQREITYSGKKAAESSADSVKYNSVSIPAGERFAIMLSDGSKVYLNSNSYIKYPVNFGSSSREVTITGRAYFDVAKTGIPFIVNTSDMKVEVLGTSFDVESRKNGKSTSVILVEGSVKIMADGKIKMLVPDEKFTIDRKNRDISVTSVDARTLTLWKDGILVLKDNTFNEMIEALCSWYGVEIINNSSVPETERFNGRFDREDIGSAIETVALSAKVSYRIEEGRLIIEDQK